MGRRTDARSRGLRQRVDLALIAFVLALVGPIVGTLTAQGASRYLLTTAIVEDGTVVLDGYSDLLGVDRATADGRVYSDKAPGQPYLGVPILAVARLLGVPPAQEAGVERNLGLWSQTLVFAMIPGAALVVLMQRHARRSCRERDAAVAALSLFVGSLLLPYSAVLYGHLLTAVLLFGAWHIVSREQPGTAAVAASGGICALAITVSYPSMIAVGCLGLWTLHHAGLRRAAWFALPASLGGAAVIVNNLLVYGTIRTGYATKEAVDLSRLPDPVHLAQIFVGRRGLVFTPIVLLALVGVIQNLRRGDRRALVPLAVFSGYLLLQSAWPNPWGGEAPGPRYLIPALPFLVGGLATSVRTVAPRVLGAVAVVSAIPMLLATITIELIAEGGTLIVFHLRYALDLGLGDTLWTMWLGPGGWSIHILLVLLAAVWVHGATGGTFGAERCTQAPIA